MPPFLDLFKFMQQTASVELLGLRVQIRVKEMIPFLYKA
jgi:hypothetical protein